MSNYQIKSNQYIPRNAKSTPSGFPMCETYYYVVNEDNKIINKHTLKTYRGRNLDMFYFRTEEGAKTLLEQLNNLESVGITELK